jgi:hypothetical protein
MKIKLFTFIAILSVSIFACKKKAAPTTYSCVGIAPTYTANIKPIIDASCAFSGCHNAASKASGIDLSTYDMVKTHSMHNTFMGSMQHLSGYDAMPKGTNKLADSILQKMSCWIANGTPQ